MNITIGMMAAGVACFFVLLAVLRWFCPQRRRRIICGVLLIGWAGVVLWVTTLSRISVREVRYHLTPFDDSMLSPWELTANTVMFVPFCGLAMGLFHRLKARQCLLAGMLAALGIELFQLISHRGICDVDDLICNSCGVAIGFLLYRLTLLFPSYKE